MNWEETSIRLKMFLRVLPIIIHIKNLAAKIWISHFLCTKHLNQRLGKMAVHGKFPIIITEESEAHLRLKGKLDEVPSYGAP